MANTVIQLKHSTLTGNVPPSLANGEISINNRDGKFFYSTPAGIVTTHYPYLGPAGLNKEVQFNDSGILGSNAGLAFDKVSGSLNVSNAIIVNGRNLDAYANAAFLQANTPSYTANSAASYANSAFAAANSGSGSSSAGPYANAAFAVANSSSSYANSAFVAANSAGVYANSSFLQANTPSYTANSAALYANGAFSAANAITSNAVVKSGSTLTGNISWNTSDHGLFWSGNTDFASIAYFNTGDDGTTNRLEFQTGDNHDEYFVWTHDPSTGGKYENMRLTPVGSGLSILKVNGIIVSDTTNTIYNQANTATSYANSAYALANNSFLAPNGAIAWATANSAASYANSGFAVSNSASTYANSAYVRANNSLNANVGGTVSGDVIITGNLTIQGTSFTANAGILTSNDTMFILGTGNYTSDVLDLGFASHYNDGTNAHSGLIRDSVTKEWYLFKGYTPEIGANNNININDASFSIDTLSANIKSTLITLRGVDLYDQITNIYVLSNSTNAVALSAASYANAAFAQANATSGVSSAGTYANSAFGVANSSASYANAAFSAANSGSGSSSAGPYANAAFAVANAAYANTSSTSFAEDTFTANGTGTTFALSTSANQYAVLVSVNGILQPNSAYTISGATLILSEAPANLDTVAVKVVSGGSSLTTVSDYANSAYATSNSAASYANAAFSAANTGAGGSSAGPYANAAFAVANSSASYANSSFLLANNIFANTGTAVSAAVYANGAFVRANNSLNANAGGTVSGDVIITGNLTIQGTSFSANAGILTSNDTMFILGIGNYSADVLDLGFAAHYNAGTNAHSGLIRDSVTKEWYLFKDYTPEIGANNNIDINDASFSIDTLSANVKSTTITLRGVDLLGQVNNSYAAANSAGAYANAAFDKANTGTTSTTTSLSPFLLMGA